MLPFLLCSISLKSSSLLSHLASTYNYPLIINRIKKNKTLCILFFTFLIELPPFLVPARTHYFTSNSSREYLIAFICLYRLPWWLSGKESVCQCRRFKFDPWLRKIPWRKKWKPILVFLPRKFHEQS